MRTGDNQSGIEQCPPEAAWPEPAAISGGSRRRSTGLDAAQSQARKAASTAQKTRRRVVCLVMAVPCQKPKWRRMRRPKRVPAKASGTQIQPWMLPVEMPESMAPTLQPKARREL